MSKKILVIEDNKKHSILFEYLLRRQGYQVVTAKNGDEVTQRMDESEKKGERFDLLLVDIAVPRFDAIAFINDRKANYQILVVSAYADTEKIKELLPDDRRIKKPFDVHIFIDSVKKIIG